MSSAGGRWVEVPQPGGTVRRDWRPDEQPPSPDGGPGDWHVVTGDGQPDRWEWVPTTAPAGRTQGAAGPMFAGSAQPGGFLQQGDVLTAERPVGRPQRSSALPKPVAIGGLAVLLAAGIAFAGMQLAGGGDSRSSTIDTAAVAASRDAVQQRFRTEIAAAFSQFQIGTDANGARVGGMQVAFTNNGQEQHSFQATLHAVGPQGGDPIATTTVEVASLDPGQTATQPVFFDVPQDKLDAMVSASVQVVSYGYLAPLPE